MEHEAFLHGMAFLINNQLDVAKIVTDASSSVQKSLGTVKLHSAYVTDIITYVYLWKPSIQQYAIHWMYGT